MIFGVKTKLKLEIIDNPHFVAKQDGGKIVNPLSNNSLKQKYHKEKNWVKEEK